MSDKEGTFRFRDGGWKKTCGSDPEERARAARKEKRDAEISEEDITRAFGDGLSTHVRWDRFESDPERMGSVALSHLARDFCMWELLGVRMTPQVALDNYVEASEWAKNGAWGSFLTNRHKWMRFDFLFEEVYEYRGRMNYVPVCAVEFDGAYHKDLKQRKLDAYKDGVCRNMGCSMVRVDYGKLRSMDETHFLEVYGDEVLKGIVSGIFMKTGGKREGGSLVTEANARKFALVVSRYTEAMETDPEHAACLMRFLQILYLMKETGFDSGNRKARVF